MKINFQGRKLAIYVAERLEHEENDPSDNWYHTFLILVDEATGPLHILQQLHYNDGPNLSLLPNVRLGVALSRRQALEFREVMAEKVFEGTSEEVLLRWNYALGYATYLKYSDISFGLGYKHDPDAVNCRSAVIATLKNIGIDYDRRHYAQQAGESCRVIPLGRVFNEASTDPVSLQELAETNEAMYLTLKADWGNTRRYIGPVRHPLLPMRRVDGPRFTPQG